MNIISFIASNFKNLTAVQITPEGNVVTLTGENGAGKSSILDGIESTLAGRDTICRKPIRDGASRGQTVTKLSNGFTITRTYTPGGSTLKIESGDETLRQPQAVLDKLIGSLTFDPLAFSRMKPAEQSETLRKLVNLDFSAIETEIKRNFDARTEVNRDVDRDKARLEKLPAVGAGVPDLPTPMQDVLDAIQKAQELDKAADLAKESAERAKTVHALAEGDVQEAFKQIAAWQKTLAIRQEVVKAHEAKKNEAFNLETQANAQRVNTAELTAKLLTLETTNASVRDKQARAACIADVRAGIARSVALTTEIDRLKEKKSAALRMANFPLPGLTFDDGGILFKGQFFDQISDGEKLRVSVAIGMALNPTLRVIFVRDGSLLDQAGLKLIAALAAEKGYQVWMEDARSMDPAAILIADGHVVGDVEIFDPPKSA